MAGFTLPAGGQAVTLDSGAADKSLLIVNVGGNDCTIQPGNAHLYAGQQTVVSIAAGTTVTATSTLGTALTVTVSATVMEVSADTIANSVQQPTVGTLGAQPAAATFGKGFYFATDDNGGTLYYSNATAWTKQSPGVSQAATPSLIATQTISANFQIPASVGANTPSDITGLSITFTAVAGATYQVRLKGSITVATVGHQGLLGIRNAANTLLDYSGTGLAPASSWTTVPMVLETYDTPGAGSVTYKAFIGYDATSSLGSSTLIAGAGFTPRITALRVA